MKWFYNLQAKYRILITIASWVPFVLFAVVSGGNVPDALVMLIPVLAAPGVIFTVLAVQAHKKEHPAEEKKQEPVQKEHENGTAAEESKVHIEYTFVDSAPTVDDREYNVKCEYVQLTTKKSIKEFRASNSYIVLDLETSGLSKYKNEIIEIAMLKVQDGQKADRFERLVKPSEPITAKIEKLTGITNDMLAAAPSFDSIADDVVSFIGNDILVAHNAKFDIGFLSAALEPREVNLKCVDTLAVARKALPEFDNHKLQTLISHYGVAETQSHRAMDDVECTQEIFVRLCDDILSHVNKKTPTETT